MPTLQVIPKRTMLNSPLHHKSVLFLFILVIILGGLMIWKTFFSETNKTVYQKVGRVQNISISNPEDTFFLGVKIPFFFHKTLKVGISIPTDTKTKEVTEGLNGEKK